MKAFEELIEEVYQDNRLRREFMKYAYLKTIGKKKVKAYKKEFPQLYTSNITYNTYQEMTYIKPDLRIEPDELRKNILYLSSSLFKTLSQKYKLEAEVVRKLREAVAARYENEL